MKLLIQLEIEYKQPENEIKYDFFIKTLKYHFENYLHLPETLKNNFKSLGKVRISRVIQ
jgi:hypothetical protein